jgi:hypothetical protein
MGSYKSPLPTYPEPFGLRIEGLPLPGKASQEHRTNFGEKQRIGLFEENP